MERVDKDGSGLIEKSEFMGLMSEIIERRNQWEEVAKTFRFYDNDDDG